jgi:hypothetical protein
MPSDRESRACPAARRADLDMWVRRGCALIVAAVAAYASYEHQREFALRGGADPTSAALWPHGRTRKIAPRPVTGAATRQGWPLPLDRATLQHRRSRRSGARGVLFEAPLTRMPRSAMQRCPRSTSGNERLLGRGYGFALPWTCAATNS